ncbi:MAG: type II secretion system GspH family protein [Deltaproteobacteria bacterium]|jgi:type II secretory pathway pseudopilin PulG|nr:type II secretion system GspH family protein [Deltaproteobacteria bacterium]
MIKILKNQNGFTGLIGLIVAVVVIGIMSAMILPTFTAKMNYKQAQYTVGVIKTIENAENAYMAKNNSFAVLTTLASQGYLSSNFLQSVQGGSYPQPNWVGMQIANQTVNACIDNGSGCPYNPGVGNNGYFIGIYNVPANFQTYVEHELPGSGSIGTQSVSYVAPVPSAPPVNAPPAPPNPAIFRSSGQFTVPYNVDTIYVTAIAGGGSGGGAWGNGGTGGNAGQYIIDQPFSVTPGEIINITIGQGGPSGWSNAGGDTIIGNLITLTGGSGGCPNCLPVQDGATGASSPFGTGGAPGIYGGWIYGGNAGGNGAGGGGGAASNGTGGAGVTGFVEISYH